MPFADNDPSLVGVCPVSIVIVFAWIREEETALHERNEKSSIGLINLIIFFKPININIIYKSFSFVQKQ